MIKRVDYKSTSISIVDYYTITKAHGSSFASWHDLTQHSFSSVRTRLTGFGSGRLMYRHLSQQNLLYSYVFMAYSRHQPFVPANQTASPLARARVKQGAEGVVKHANSHQPSIIIRSDPVTWRQYLCVLTALLLLTR